MKTFFRFVSPYALGNPARPDQGFTSSDCSTAIDRREPFLRSHMLLSGNRKANQEPQKNFSSVFSTLFRSRPKIFLAKEPLTAETVRGSFFWIPFYASRWLAGQQNGKNSAYRSAGPTQNERGKKKMKAKAKVNDLIRIYTEEGDYLIENPYRVTHIDRRFLPKKIYYEAQSLDGLIDIKFLEETEFERIR